jgi:hypothetical protein
VDNVYDKEAAPIFGVNIISMNVEVLEQLEHATRPNPESRSYKLYGGM